MHRHILRSAENYKRKDLETETLTLVMSFTPTFLATVHFHRPYGPMGHSTVRGCRPLASQLFNVQNSVGRERTNAPFAKSRAWKTRSCGLLSVTYVTDHFTCISTNVIYCITCSLCKKIYKGETRRGLADRFREHIRDVEKKQHRCVQTSRAPF